MIEKCRKGNVWGRLWLCHTEYRDNVYGKIERGTLIETRGKITDETFNECCQPLEEENEYTVVDGFEMKIITANRRRKPV